MWLDGVYIGRTFFTQNMLQNFRATVNATKESFDKIVLQFDLIEKYNRDPETGLYYHGCTQK